LSSPVAEAVQAAVPQRWPGGGKTAVTKNWTILANDEHRKAFHI